MPAPKNLVDTEPGDGGRPRPPGPEGGRRPPWWRRALQAAIRTVGRLVRASSTRNERGTYRGLGREARQAIRERRPGDLFRG